MNDITKNYRFQRILHEAAQYRTLRQIFEAGRDYETPPQPVDYYRPDRACDHEKNRAKLPNHWLRAPFQKVGESEKLTGK